MFDLDKNNSSELLIKVTNINSIYNIMIQQKKIFIKKIE